MHCPPARNNRVPDHVGKTGVGSRGLINTAARILEKEMSRSWTYDEITEAAEAEISRCMRDAKTLSDPEIGRNWAYGVYLFWVTLTNEHRKPGDSARLRAMAGIDRLEDKS